MQADIDKLLSGGEKAYMYIGWRLSTVTFHYVTGTRQLTGVGPPGLDSLIN